MYVDEGQTIRPSPHVVARDVKDGAMLVDLQTGACFKLNRVGAEIWRTILESASISETCTALAARYTVNRDVIEKDVAGLLTELQSKGLVTIASTRG